MHHVQLMGAIWRVSNRDYKRLIKDIEADIEIDLDKYGKMVIDKFESFEDLKEEIWWNKEET